MYDGVKERWVSGHACARLEDAISYGVAEEKGEKYYQPKLREPRLDMEFDEKHVHFFVQKGDTAGVIASGAKQSNKEIATSRCSSQRRLFRLRSHANRGSRG